MVPPLVFISQTNKWPGHDSRVKATPCLLFSLPSFLIRHQPRLNRWWPKRKTKFNPTPPSFPAYNFSTQPKQPSSLCSSLASFFADRRTTTTLTGLKVEVFLQLFEAIGVGYGQVLAVHLLVVRHEVPQVNLLVLWERAGRGDKCTFYTSTVQTTLNLWRPLNI